MQVVLLGPLMLAKMDVSRPRSVCSQDVSNLSFERPVYGVPRDGLLFSYEHWGLCLGAMTKELTLGFGLSCFVVGDISTLVTYA